MIFFKLLNIIFIQIYTTKVKVRSTFTRYNLLRLGATIDRNLEIKQGSHISFARNSHLKIGKNLRLDENCSIYISPGASLEIGDNVFIGKGSVIATGEKISIGSDTQIAHYITIIDTDHRYGHSNDKIHSSGSITKPIAIGTNVWIGTNAIILKGVSIGNDSVIGAGSVVTKSVDEKHIAFGNPASARPITK